MKGQHAQGQSWKRIRVFEILLMVLGGKVEAAEQRREALNRGVRAVSVSGKFWQLGSPRLVLDFACLCRQAMYIVVYGYTREMLVVWPGRGVMVLWAVGSGDMRKVWSYVYKVRE